VTAFPPLRSDGHGDMDGGLGESEESDLTEMSGGRQGDFHDVDSSERRLLSEEDRPKAMEFKMSDFTGNGDDEDVKRAFPARVERRPLKNGKFFLFFTDFPPSWRTVDICRRSRGRRRRGDGAVDTRHDRAATATAKGRKKRKQMSNFQKFPHGETSKKAARAAFFDRRRIFLSARDAAGEEEGLYFLHDLCASWLSPATSGVRYESSYHSTGARARARQPGGQAAGATRISGEEKGVGANVN